MGPCRSSAPRLRPAAGESRRLAPRPCDRSAPSPRSAHRHAPAREVLEALGRGRPGAPATQDAMDALLRLSRERLARPPTQRRDDCDRRNGPQRQSPSFHRSIRPRRRASRPAGSSRSEGDLLRRVRGPFSLARAESGLLRRHLRPAPPHTGPLHRAEVGCRGRPAGRRPQEGQAPCRMRLLTRFRCDRLKKSVSGGRVAGITSKWEVETVRRRHGDGEHRGGDRAETCGGCSTAVRCRAWARPSSWITSCAATAGRGGLRGDPDAARVDRAGLLPSRARRRRRGRGRLPGDVPGPVPPGRIDPGCGLAGAWLLHVARLSALKCGRVKSAAAHASAASRGRRPRPPRRRPTSASWCPPRSIACRGSTATRSSSATSKVERKTTRRWPLAGRPGRSAGGCRGRGRCSGSGSCDGISASPRWR